MYECFSLIFSHMLICFNLFKTNLVIQLGTVNSDYAGVICSAFL